MISSCLSQFWGWKIPILVGVGRGQSGISRRFNGFLVIGASYSSSWTHKISACSSFHLKFFHHISAPIWSEAHLVSYSSIWGRLSWSSILYYDLNDFLFNFRNISGRNANKSHVLLLNIEEIVPFPHYLVVNSCNVYGFEWMYKILMNYELMEYN